MESITNLIEKRQLFPGLLPTSPSLLALPHQAPKHRPLSSSLGILTQRPFGDNRPVDLARKNKIPAVATAFAASLGPTDPCSTAVHMEPFSTLVLKILT